MQRFYGRRSTFNLPTFNPRAPRLSPHLLSPLAARLTPRPSRLGRPRSRRGSFHQRRSTVGARSTAETSRVEDVPPHPRSTRNLQPATFASHPSLLSPRASRLTPHAVRQDPSGLGRPRSRRGSFHQRRSTVGARSTAETSRVEDVPPHPRSTRNLQPAICNLQPATFASSLITPPPVPPASRLWRPAHRRRRADAG